MFSFLVVRQALLIWPDLRVDFFLFFFQHTTVLYQTCNGLGNTLRFSFSRALHCYVIYRYVAPSDKAGSWEF